LCPHRAKNYTPARCEAAEQRAECLIDLVATMGYYDTVAMTLITAKAVAPLPVASVRDFLVGRGLTKPFPQRAFVPVRLGGRCSRAKMRLSASGYRLHKAGRLPRNHPARNFSISPTVRGTPELNSSHPLLVTINSSSMRMPKPLSAR